MNLVNLVVHKGLVAQKHSKTPQLFRVSAETVAGQPSMAKLQWQNVSPDGTLEEPFADANIHYESANVWLDSWSSITHLVQGRVESLELMAREGAATRFFKDTAYWMFAKSLVDYSSKYRGMQSVILNGMEAVADVVLDTNLAGSWTIPPHFIDSVFHIAGFIMNVSDAVDNTANFCVTPGWQSLRLARPLVPGGRYKSYTKMIPTAQDPTVYLGDVYVLQDGAIIGMMGSIQFRRYPRILLSRFFSPPDSAKSQPIAAPPSSAASNKSIQAPKVAVELPKATKTVAVLSPPAAEPVQQVKVASASAPEPVVAVAATATEDSGIVAQALALIAAEAGIELSELQDDVQFNNLGIDSLLSLVIAEKFRAELGVPAAGGLFLEYPTVGEVRAWLTEYYG
jgi:monodictyphenone polyketide synthase